jgi:hypothetical protein
MRSPKTPALRRRLALGSLFLLLAANTPALAQDEPEPIRWQPAGDPTPSATLEFVSLRRAFGAGEVELANGAEVIDPSQWETVAIAASDDGVSCTSTLVGPRVLLTAAHCVDRGDPPTASPQRTKLGTVRFRGGPIRLLSCTMHPGYASKPWRANGTPRSDLDVALCELAAPVQGMEIETVDAGGRPAPNDPLLMMGFGCINIRVSAGKLVFDPGRDKLRMGAARIQAAGVSGKPSIPGAYLRTRSTAGEPILCPGDSGGPAFRGATMGDQTGSRRRLLAVNSMVEAVPVQGGHIFNSYATLVTEADFKTFQRAWTDERPTARGVCGDRLDPAANNCRK